MTEVSTVRMYALRLLYLLNFVGLGLTVWPTVLSPDKPLGLLDGVAFSFWAALSALMGLGLRYPLQMLPLLLLQLSYKVVWLLAVALPLRSAGLWDSRATGLTKTFVLPVVLDLLVIPWAYVLANYIKKPGDSWKLARALQEGEPPTQRPDIIAGPA
jgi:hypothetical protein